MVRGSAVDADGTFAHAHRALVPDRRILTAVGYLSCAGAARTDDAELRIQARTVERYCIRRGWHVAEMVHDTEAPRGRSRSRPGLSYVLEQARGGHVGCLVVTELGRLCRSVAELRRILEAVDAAGARLVVLDPPLDTGTAEGRAVALALSAVSEWEHRRAAARSTNALAVARANGSTPPAIPPPLKRRIIRMRSAGLTLQAIADELNEAGIPTVRGGAEWRPSSVQAAIGYRRPPRS
jgi:DNA invertase Pin-like site-specific DNA recombinase